MDTLHLSSVVIALSLIVCVVPASAQTPNSRINWLEVCRSPLIDAAVAEPCETLTSPDGYSLTSDGLRVIGCYLGGGLLLAYDQSGKILAAAQQLGTSSAFCGGMGNPSESSNGNPSNGNPIGNLLKGLFGH